MKKKTSKPTTKKAAIKKPTAKKSTSKPKRKAQGRSELLDVVARLALITERLAETTERLAQLAAGPALAQEPPADDPAQDQHEAPADFSAAPKAGEGGDPTDSVPEE